MPLTREEFLYMAKVCEQSERYEDMLTNMKALLESAIKNPTKPEASNDDDKEDLNCLISEEERNLLSVAFKNMVGTRRTAWRSICMLEEKETKKGDSYKIEILTSFKKRLEDELDDICNDIIGILDKDLITDNLAAQTKVFFLKMKADYYRYIAEYATGEKKENVIQAAKEAYSQANDVADKEKLKKTNPVRLGLSLNFSVFYYEALKSPKEACELAKRAFDDAISEIETIDESDYKDATTIMQLIRDNLTLWTSEMEADEDDDQ